MSRRLLALLMAVALISALAACGNDSDDSSASATESTSRTPWTWTATTTAAPSEDPDEPIQAPPSVEAVLLDPGAEPRSELRLDLSPGSTSTYVITMTTRSEVETTGQETEAETVEYTMRVSLEARVLDVEDGIADVSMVFTSTELVAVTGDIDRREIAELQDEVDELVGFETRMGLDTRGGVQWLEISPGLDPWMSDFMDEVVPDPLPEEPVGVGARWVVETPLPPMSGFASATSEYHLIEHEGDVILAEVTLAFTPGTDAFSTLFSELSAVGHGTSRWDLTTPRQLEDVRNDIVMGITTGRGDNQVEMTTSIQLDLVATAG